MKTYFRILSYVKKYLGYLTLSILFTVLFSLMNGASVYLSIPLLQTLFNEKKAETVQEKIIETPEKISGITSSITSKVYEIKKEFTDYIFSGSNDEILLKIVALVLLTFLLKNIFNYLQVYYLAYVQQAVIRDMRNDIFTHLHKLSMSFFKKERTGNLISRIISDTLKIQQSISTVFLSMIREPLTIIVFLGMAFSISVRLTLFSFIILPLSLVVIVFIGRILRRQSAALQAKMADITSVIHETVTGAKIVKAFGMEKFEENRFKKQTQKYFRIMLKMTRVRGISSPVSEFISVSIGAVIIYYGGKLVLVDHTLAASEFLGFLFAILQIMHPIKELSGVNNKIQESSAAADRVFQIIDLEPEIKDAPDAIEKKTFERSIRFDDVYFKYDDAEDWILRNVNFEVNKGEILALVGSSGGGKTTLVDLLPRFFDVTKGAILLDEIDIRKIKLSDLRKLIGVVTQETILFNTTIRNNIAYGNLDVSEEKIIEAAKAANAYKFIMELPKGFDTVVGEHGVRLSGGQRQRISIARALLKNPPIMIFDEATSALDNESEVLVQEAIEKLMKDRTVFVIAHRLSTIRNADRIIVLDKGEIVQMGKHDELIKDEKGVYKKLYDLQFKLNNQKETA